MKMIFASLCIAGAALTMVPAFSLAAPALNPVSIATTPVPPSDGMALHLQDRGNGSYSVEGSFVVQADQKTVWDVISDYNHLPRFVSSMNFSNVEERRPESLLVRQKFTAKAIFLRHSVEVLLQVKEQPYDAIEFTDILRKNFKLYSGSWRIGPLDGGMTVSYRLELEGGFAGPKFIVKRTSRKMIATLLGQVKSEIERRSKR